MKTEFSLHHSNKLFLFFAVSACRGQADTLDWPYLKFGVCKRERRVLFLS